VINSRSGSSAPAGYHFPREVIAVAVRWYLSGSFRAREESVVSLQVAASRIHTDFTSCYGRRHRSGAVLSARPPARTQ
jgi:transposase-like protein